MDLAESIDRTFQHTHSVISGIRPDQYGNATPCSEWTVQDLLQHMIAVVGGMGAAVSGATAGDRAPFELASEPAGQFKELAAATLAAWQTPGVMERVVNGFAGPMPGQVYAQINLIDTATHTWDLAKATGQPTALPDDVAEAALEASKAIIAPELRAGRFGPEQEAPAGADTTSRLVSFLGRTP